MIKTRKHFFFFKGTLKVIWGLCKYWYFILINHFYYLAVLLFTSFWTEMKSKLLAYTDTDFIKYQVLTILGDFPYSIPINERVLSFSGGKEVRLQFYESRVTSFMDQKRPRGACKIFIIFNLQEMVWWRGGWQKTYPLVITWTLSSCETFTQTKFSQVLFGLEPKLP